MNHDAAWLKARAERDELIGLLLSEAALIARDLHRELGLPDTMLVVVDETGVRVEAKPDGWPGRPVDAAVDAVGGSEA